MVDRPVMDRPVVDRRDDAVVVDDSSPTVVRDRSLDERPSGTMIDSHALAHDDATRSSDVEGRHWKD